MDGLRMGATERGGGAGAYRTDAYSSCAGDECLLITNIPPMKPRVSMAAAMMSSDLARPPAPPPPPPAAAAAAYCSPGH